MGNELINYEKREMLDVLKATVAVGTTDAEFKMFVEYCKGTGFNPFKREAWCIVTPEKEWTDRKTGQKRKKERRIQIMTGIMGYLAAANDHAQYDGMKYDVERDKDGKPFHATVEVYRKDRKFPSIGEAWAEEDALFSDYGNGVWDTRTSTMLLKVAKARALREAFPQQLGGSHIPEEMGPEYQLEKPESPAAPGITDDVATRPKKETKKLIAKIDEQEQQQEQRATAKFTYDAKLIVKAVGADKWPATWAKAKSEYSCTHAGSEVYCERKVEGWDGFLIAAPEVNDDDPYACLGDLPDSMKTEAA